MYIFPVNFQPKTYTLQPRVNFRGRLEKDVVNFSKKEFLTLPPKEIWARIKASLSNAKNFIGIGGEAKVWKIEGTNYCIRIVYDAVINQNLKPDFNISEKDKVNHVVAKFDDDFTIMPVIEGVTFYSNKINNDKVASIVENMPQEAFDRLFLQVYHAEKIGMKFDSGPCNIIINPEELTMTAIDFSELVLSTSMMSRILWSLVPQYISNEAQVKHCAGRIMLALLTALNSGCDIDLGVCGISRFIDSVVDNKNYARILKNEFEKISNGEASITGSEKVIRAVVRQLFFDS